MSTQYSILSALIRPEIQEKISIGLLLFNTDQVYFSYSRNKLQAAKTLLSPASFGILKDTLDNIGKKIEPRNSLMNTRKKFAVVKTDAAGKMFSASYIQYLSRYSNNIISFTNPKDISIELTEDNFRGLFENYIDKIVEYPDTLQKIKPMEFIKNNYGEKIKAYYDLNREITHEQVENLITPVRIDFAGKNEIDVYAQTVDMGAGVVTVSNHINAFMQLKATYQENKTRLKDFIIAEEPSKKTSPKQHDIWKQLKDSRILNYLDLSESEAIITYAERHGVMPLSTHEG